VLYKRSKVVQSSLKELDANAFAVVNWKGTANVTSGIAENDTLSSNTKTGVLSGSVVAYSGSYLVGQCNTTNQYPCGLFVQDCIPDNFMNAPAIASNKVPVAQFGGEFEVDIFETHSQSSPFSSVLSSYTIGAKLYSSDNGLLTNEISSAHGFSTAIVVAQVTWQPVSNNLIMGLDLLIP